MPRNVTHTAPASHRHPVAKALHTPSHGTCTTAVRERRDFTLAPEIPDYGVASATGCCQSVLDMVVPRERRDLVQLSASCAWRVGLARIFEIPNVYLKRIRRE